MTEEREELIRRNLNIKMVHMPDLSEMTNEELEKRANFWENMFQIAVKTKLKENTSKPRY
ncbi:MAG: hypothetical protein ABS939_00275 [Psychrobacillus sp.]